MKKQKAGNISEMAILGGIALGVCAISVFVFGDNLGQILANNPIKTTFTANRTAIVSNANSSDNVVKVRVNGQEFSAPLQSVIRNKLVSGTLQTSGSSGNIDETVDVLNAYATQMQTFLNSLPNSAAKTNLANQIQAFSQSINDYKGMNQTTANSTNIEVAKKLEFLTDLEVSGTNALQFNDAVNNLLNDPATIIPPETAKMIDMYRDAMINLGSSTDFKVDSRLLSDIGAKEDMSIYNQKNEEVISTLSEMANNSNIMNNISPDLQDQLKGLIDLNNLTSTLNSTAAFELANELKKQLDNLNPSATAIKDVKYNGCEKKLTIKLTDTEKFTIKTQDNGQIAEVKLGNVNYTVSPEQDGMYVFTNNVIENSSSTTGIWGSIFVSIADTINRSIETTNTTTTTIKIPKDAVIKDAQGHIIGLKPPYQIAKSINNTTKTQTTSYVSNIFGCWLNPILSIASTNTTSATNYGNAPVFGETAKNLINSLYAQATAYKTARTNILTKLNNEAHNNGNDLSSKIRVFRNGSYANLLGDSQNANTICFAVNSVVSGNVCSTH